MADVVMVPLSQGKVAIIDAEDAEAVLQYRWYAAERETTWYAYRSERRNGKTCTVYLHRYIMGEPVGKEVDHRNLDGLDCQRSNLRVATRSQQNMNQRCKSKLYRFKGVWLDGRAWRARYYLNGKGVMLGTFTSEEEAARAYDRAVLEAFGEFARLNFPIEEGQAA